MENTDTQNCLPLSYLTRITNILEDPEICLKKRAQVLELAEAFCKDVENVVNNQADKLSRSKENEVIQQAMTILHNRLKLEDFIITCPDDAKNFLIAKLSQKEQEVFAVMFLNNKHQLIRYKEMFFGTVDGASVHPREVVKASMKYNAAAVVVSHNHPSGIPEPSESDRRITHQLKETLTLIDVRVLDHIIVGAGVTYSFAESGHL